MIVNDDPRWKTMQGGYRIPFDSRSHLRRLEASPADERLWNSLVEELYHQGDVGEASYVAVVLIAENVVLIKELPWRMFLLVAAIEVARTEEKNPAVPAWLLDEYMEAIQSIGRVCMEALERTVEIKQLRGMLSLICLAKGFRVYGRALQDYSEEELKEYLPT